jgi:ectoine hydroxylase-related dioxygenase (phytanoyl-CoA dioxygenase family)
VTAEQVEIQAESLDPKAAAAIYQEHGCLVVRGLMAPYARAVHQDIMTAAQRALESLGEAEKIVEGWRTPDGTLFIPAPEHFGREQQLMVVALSYHSSAAFFRSALDSRVAQIAEIVLGLDVELFGNGQVLVKEPHGGHAKHLHQDSAYFEHKYQGPMAILSYAGDTSVNNGALHVVPGSHRLGVLDHIDTFSHLGLDEKDWPWEKAVPIEGTAGDAIFFHVNTIHGSPENLSNTPRPVFISRYRRADDFVTVGGTTAENRADAASHPKSEKSDSDRGLMILGSRH